MRRQKDGSSACVIVNKEHAKALIGDDISMMASSSSGP
jgi:hypothetical protein